MKIKDVLNIVLYKTYAELKLEVNRSYIGLLWWVVEPILYMLTFYLVFGLLMERGGENYIVYLLIGLVSWKWFASSVLTASLTIYSNRGLIQQLYIPKSVFPLSVVCANTFKFSIVFIILIVFIVFYGYSPNINWLYLPLVVIIQFILTTSLALFFSSIVPLVPDMKFIIDNGMMMLMFISGIFFEIKALPERYQSILYANPMAALVSVYRDILMGADSIALWLLMNVFIFSLSMLIIAMFIQSRFDRLYPKLVR